MESDRPQVASADSTNLLETEARAVWDLTQAGCIRAIYFRSDRPRLSSFSKRKRWKTRNGPSRNCPSSEPG